jgi:glycosyltransferase involved in cell wall biosynthesis
MRSNTNHHVLYLSMDGLTDPLGQSQILPYVVGLTGHGYKFTVISFEKEARFKNHGKSVSAYCKEKGIHWIPLTYHRHPAVISTLYDVYILRKTVTRLHRQHPFSLVHCRSYVTALVGQWMRKKYDVKFIFDMRGFWADERVEGGLWNLRNPIYRSIYNFFKRREKQFLKHADHVIVLTENARSIIQSDRHLGVSTIPTCVDLHLFDPSTVANDDVVRRRRQLGIEPGDFVLLYLGSWGTWYKTDDMLAFFKVLKKKEPDAKFLILTNDTVMLKGYPYTSSVIKSSATRHEIPLHIRLSDASIFFISPTFSKRGSSATKFGELMAMNCKVVTNSGWGDVDGYHEVVDFALIAEAAQYEIIAEKLLSQRWTPRTREWAIENLSLEKGVMRYQTIYRQIMQS